MRIVLIGKPGSGKGTQAGLLSREYGWPHLSSGAILREEIAEGTDLGKKVEKFVLRGEIGPEKLITSAILDHIERKGMADAFILDGFPRTIYQSEQLDVRFRPEKAILLDLEDDKVIQRLSRRRTCEKCGAIYHTSLKPPSADGICDDCGGSISIRPDDRDDAIRKRLEVFALQVGPVIDRYRKSGRLVEIEGVMHPVKAFQSIQSALSD